MVQPNQPDQFMRIAVDEARLGLSEGGIPIGSSLMRDGQLLGKGHNRRVQHGDPIAHVKDLTAGHGADVVIEAAGTPETWSQAMLMARKGGTVVQFSGLPGGTQVSFDATHLHYGEITMKGVFHATPRTVELAAQMLDSGTVSVKPILDGVIPLSQVEDGLLRMQRSEVIKLAVVPSLSA